MKTLALAEVAIERVPADVAVVALFADERPLRGAAGRLDWRLCGRLSRLVAAGRLSGQSGEAVLTPGGGGVRARAVVGLGLGSRADLDAGRWAVWAADALERAAKLGAGRAVIDLPEAGEAAAERLSALSRAASAESVPQEILLSAEQADAAVVSHWFRSMARRSRRAPLEICSPAERAAPAGGRGLSPAAQPVRSSGAPAGRSTR